MRAGAPRPGALDWDSPLSAIHGIGAVRARELSREGYERIADLLLRAPRRYEDRTRLRTLAELRALEPGSPAPTLVGVVSCRTLRTRRRGLTIVRARLSDGVEEVEAVWFNQPYLGRHLTPGRRLILYGSLKSTAEGKPVIENAEIEIVPCADEEPAPVHMGRIVPVHRRIGGLSPRRLRTILHAAIDALPGTLPDPLPGAIVDSRRLAGRRAAVAELHFPREGTLLSDLAAFRTPAQRRLAYEELFLLCAAFEIKRRRRASAATGGMRLPSGWVARLARGLPYPLTPGQRAALEALARRMAARAPMAVLLQGDVGCGKTAVAMLAMFAHGGLGNQAALMAPTEVLAAQHFRTLGQLATHAGLEVGLLTGSQPAGERRSTRERLAAGDLRLVVGTHALAREATRFRRLGLAVVDEQHRFGVAERLRLAGKGDDPHLLVMTATPIPRSLALSIHGDLDRIEIRDRPPGRGVRRTRRCPPAERARAFAVLRQEVERRRKGYVVCPRIGADGEEHEDAAAAEATHERLTRDELRGLEVGLLHGALPPRERAQVVERFTVGPTQVLVATSIVEVGVDLPEATVMVIEGAEAFGLVQLHQMRGRIGRGPDPAVCFLMHGESPGAAAERRLAILESSDDGFAIAEADLELRGTGELLGRRQHGDPGLRLADLARDSDLLEQARADAEALSAADLSAGVERAALARWGESIGLLADA